MIAAKVANALALDYPRDRLEVIVVAATARRTARRRWRAQAGADVVLDNCRAAARSARRTPPSSAPDGDIVAFSDANSTWEPDALRALVAPFADPRVGYVCGQVRSSTAGARTRRACTGATRCGCAALESRLASVTGGNGAIYATRREAYIEVDPIMGHDLSLPVQHGQARLARRLRAGGARDREDGALDRGRVRPQAADDEPRLADRPARRAAVPARLPAALRAHDRLAPGAALRRAVPAPGGARAERRARRVGAGPLYASPSRPRSRSSSRRCSPAPCRARPLLVARYYVLTQASLAAGLWDWLRHGTPAGWEPAGGHAVKRALRRRRRRRAACSLGGAGPGSRRWSRSGSSRPGHPIYRQRRIGRDGAPFDISSCARWCTGPSTWAPAWP